MIVQMNMYAEKLAQYGNRFYTKKKIQGHIFRIEEHPSDVFVDEYFKCLIEKNGFTGIDFELIELS